LINKCSHYILSAINRTATPFSSKAWNVPCKRAFKDARGHGVRQVSTGGRASRFTECKFLAGELSVPLKETSKPTPG